MSYAAKYDDPSAAGAGLSMKDASSRLGVPAPTLRSWERRYGLPTTARSVGGHRRYRSDALVQLSLMRDEIAMGRGAADAARWVRGLLDVAHPGAARVDALLDASSRLDADGIRRVLDDGRAELGLGGALDDVMMPAMRQIGTWWESGVCDVGQEQLATATIRAWLARLVTLAAAPDPASRTVLLATGPHDFHTLGLEALAAQLAQLRVPSRLLGAHTSTEALLAALARAPDAVVVMVSHLPTRRRSAVGSLRAATEAGAEAFFAGNAFLLPVARRDVPGTYLGERIAAAGVEVAARAGGS